MSNTALVVTKVENKQLDALRQIATQATDPKEVRTRKGRGGMVFKYVDGPYVIRTLNQAFGHDWDFEADNEEVIDWLGQPFEVRCRGRLTVRLNGQAVTKMQYGSQAIEFIKERDKDGKVFIVGPVSIGDCFKGAATDALKKCASMLGVALDLYDSDYRADKYMDSSDDGRDESEPVEPEPEPQPTPPPQQRRGARPRGAAGQIVALAEALKWNDKVLADEIQARIGFAVGIDIVAALEELPKLNQMELIQSMKAELTQRTK